MTNKQGIFLCILLMLLSAAVTYASLRYEPVAESAVEKPVIQEPVATRPERLRYAIWFSDCGAEIGVLLTDSEGPPLWLFAQQPLSFTEQMDVLTAIAAGRELYVDTGNADCRSL